jgi:peptidoglycan/xylan/chitin deacetylase (PgdA/CDA1 family)
LQLRETSQNSPRFLLPAYHEIYAGESKYLYGTTAANLASQVGSLAELPVGPVATFDDAFLSQYELGVPVLDRNRVKGIFFAIVERTGIAPEYMGWSQLRELVQMGHEVQSHSYSHVALTRCSDADLKRELELSKSVVEEKLGIPVTGISIPFGRWDSRVLDACRSSGYSRVYTSDPTPYSVKGGVEVIGRFMVRNSTSTERFRQLALAQGHDLLGMRAIHSVKAMLRRIMGDRNYHLLWCLMSRRESNPDGEYV